MNYPFVSILPLVDEVQNELKTIVKTSAFTDEDIYGWMIEASRLIGTPSYEPVVDYILEVSKHVALLPKDFYLIDNLYICEIQSMSGNGNHPHPATWIRSRVLRPADTMTRTRCSSKCDVNNNSELSYTIKVPPGVARFSFFSGKVAMDYERMKTGSDGSILVQDEPNTTKALKTYAKVMLLHEKYIMGEVARYIYNDLNTEWESYKEKAQTTLNFPSQADTDYLSLKQDARYRQLRYKDQ